MGLSTPGAGATPSFFRPPLPPGSSLARPSSTAAPPPPAPPRAPGPTDAAPLPPAVPAGFAVRRLVFHGSGGSLFGIHLVNILLTIVTLGVYYFWAKVRVRQYLLGQTAFEGDRFAYHGTGRELLIGFAKALIVFGVPALGLILVRDILDVPEEIKGLAAFAVSALILVVLPLAMVSARRYRLSRTSWRGIRFSFRGRPWEFVKVFVAGTVLSALTFGLYYPFFDTRRFDFMMSHAYFGNRRFWFDGRGWDLLPRFLLTVLLALPTVGLSIVWYVARKRRYFWSHSGIAAARFRSTVRGGPLLGLWAGNLALLVLTLGFGWPWARVRSVRFALRYLTLEGPLDIAAIEQEAQTASATGEGLSTFLDSGFDFG
ncbi:MAG: DUF898 domain-containing protein [Candidatus Rokubacteria bacterium]|nr:DUF898 domain-containing protein [Candidatus Rokubacteria bacterium]